jgi:hypothetical protein
MDETLTLPDINVASYSINLSAKERIIVIK